MNKTKRPKKKLPISAIVLIVSCIVIAVPVVIFLVIIAQAALTNNTPSFGKRFDNDLNPTITAAQIENIESNIDSIGNVDSCEVVLTTAQLRVNIDAKDSTDQSDIEEITKEAYDIVNKELPVSTYFKMADTGERMYDLAINTYNFIPENNDDEKWISYILTKNSKMGEYSTQLISSPINAELAKELRGETPSEEASEEKVEETDDTKTSE